MTAMKAADVARRIGSPQDVPPLCLVYGPDRGHVSEIASAIAKTALEGSEDPFALVTLGADDIGSDAARIVDEARTISMFGGRRLVWVKDAGTRNISGAIAPLAADLPTDAVVLLEAGDLKKSAPLRKLLEGHRSAITIACYPDAVAELDRIIEAEAHALDLAIDRDARDMLHALLGGDRLASRGEVTKLLLYARGDGTVTPDHVRAIVGDVSTFGAGDAVDQAFLGHGDTLDVELQKLWTAGTNPSVVAGAALRWCQTLLSAAGETARGKEPRAVVERMTPPVTFQRKAAVSGMLEMWRPERLEQVARRLDAAVLSARKHPALSREIASAALHEVAIRAGQNRRRR